MYHFEIVPMKIRLLSILGLLFSPLSVYTQYLPDLQIPDLKPSHYESLQTKTIPQTPIDFQMKGPVKTVCETVHSLKTNGADSSAYLKVEYFFSGKGKLVKYREDSASTLYNSHEFINRVINTYDSSGAVLLETIRWVDKWQKSKTVIRFNEQGFREQEVYTCYDCEQGWNKKDPFYDSIFDYTLDYHWSPDFDSVNLKYRYVKQKSPYQRNQDGVRSFVHEIKMKNKEKTKAEPKLTMDRVTLNFQSFSEDIQYDNQGRITQWIIWDHTIKNSMNIHQKIKYAYNEKGEVTWIEHSSTTRTESDFELDSWVEINYILYDKYGNWIEKEVKVTSSNYGLHDILRNSSYCYKREFTYY